jgi:hypothetical protein
MLWDEFTSFLVGAGKFFCFLKFTLAFVFILRYYIISGSLNAPNEQRKQGPKGGRESGVKLYRPSAWTDHQKHHLRLHKGYYFASIDKVMTQFPLFALTLFVLV